MKQNIYRSAALVTVFSTVEKALSFFYRIVLSRIIGAEGLGIYQICLSVFAVFLTAASSGIPVILFFGRNLLGFLFTDDRCMNVFILLLPGLILTSIYAVMRGSFWGNKQFLPYSIIELLEDAVMVVLGCILVYGVTDPVAGAERAAIAVLVSYVFSFIVSLFWYFKKGGRFSNPKRQLKPLFSSSMPITAMRTSTSVLNSAVAILLPVLLMNAYGLDNSEAISLYGVAIGMSVPILFIPSALIGSISVVVAPELAENYYKNKTALVKFDIEKSVKAAIFIATLIIPVLFVLGDEIGSVLYSNEMSGEIIQNCAFILLPMCLAMITTTVLNSMNCEKKTLLYYIIGAALMIVSIVALTRFVGVYSYMIGLAASFVISAVFNLRLLAKKCEGIKFISYILRSIVVVIATCAFGMMLDGIISRYVATVWQMVICAPACLIFASAFLMCFEMFSFKPFKKLFKKA